MKEAAVILVNEQDQQTGTMEKMQAHREGLLHRAFSVFIFNNAGMMLLQQRAGSKYHGAYLWTNACCSHPYPGEEVADAAKRRLQEELGFTTKLEKLFAFTYRADVENDLIEHEYDHVFGGVYNEAIHPNPDEVADYRFSSMEQIKAEMQQKPNQFTSWFRIAFPKIEQWWQKEFAHLKN